MLDLLEWLNDTEMCIKIQGQDSRHITSADGQEDARTG